jgi:ABC-type glycerol-3-phosphate transport system substrate-binding protein
LGSTSPSARTLRGACRGSSINSTRNTKGEIKVTWQKTAAASDAYFEQIKTQLQSEKATVDVIGGDVIWPAQFAA